ncbi:MAG TPA: glycosyltransferase family 39 protein, partial [Phototrophicaceae bacterium]|nr:glycosyltransferase family 39 protein [Phototrophicaceae bacterium]
MIRTFRVRHLILLILLFYAAMVLYYANTVPLLESSDEGAHFLYIHNLLVDRALPVIDNRESIAEQPDPAKRFAVESHQPPLYYLIGAVLISPTQRSDIDTYFQPNPLIFFRGIMQDNANVWLHTLAPTTGDTGTAIWILRLYSLALSVGTLLLIYRSARLALNTQSLALASMLLVACIPTFINIGGSVNNDNLVTLLYTAGVYWSLRTWRYGIRPRDIAIISLILAAIALTKINGLTLFPVTYLALIIGVQRRRYPLKRALQVIAVSLIATAILAGWWYIRNLTLYGDLLATSATLSLWGRNFANPTQSGNLSVEITRVWN